MIIMIFFCLLHAPFDFSQGDTGCADDDRIAWIDADQQNNMLHIRGMFYNATDGQQTITYKLTTERTGKSGTSQTSQSGEHFVEPADTVELSRTSVNVEPEDCYTLTLDVFKNDTKIATDKIRHCTEDDQGEDS